MAILVRVQNDFQIIVPARVDRAVRGQPVLDAPDVDDRGWVNNRAAGLNVADTRGALFSATVGDTVRLQVIREDIDDGVPLFVTASGNQVTIASPAGGGPLPASGIFSVRAVRDTQVGSRVEVRLGSTAGAILCEADAHTFTETTLRVAPHVCQIFHAAAAPAGVDGRPQVNGAALDAAGVDQIFDLVKAIWRPAGITFQVDAVRNETFVNFTADGLASRNPPAGGTEEDTVISRNSIARRCNIYFIRFMDRSLGVGVRVENRANDGLTHSGIIIGVEGQSGDALGTAISNRSSNGADLVHELGNDVAHELGHFLTLSHADQVNNSGRSDTYARRRLMHPQNLLPFAATPLTATSVPRFDDIGYGVGGSGKGHRGCLITLKDNPTDRSDGETVSARRRFGSANLFA